jgi:murein DD-endopeptidase MepM/ murein hydrolase activator NlpD
MRAYQTWFKLWVGVALWVLWMVTPAMAAPPIETQQQETGHFIYTVQPGDTLARIALKHNLSPADIALANNLSNPRLIFPGQQLILPGVPPPRSPSSTPEPASLHTVLPGETLFEIASRYGVTVGALALTNNLPNPDMIEVGHILKIPTDAPPEPGARPVPFVAIELSEPVIMQGRTLVVKVNLSTPNARLSGHFEGHPLRFWGGQNGMWWTIIPIHALAEPNTYPIILVANLIDGTSVTAYGNVVVFAGPYGQENIRLDESRGQLLDAELIKIEQEKMTGLWSQVTPRPRWEGPFWYPVEFSQLRITSYFGTRRSYNNGEGVSFHGGTDFGGQVGMPVYAPAAGTVVLAETLTIRGKAVLIDHGVGLFSGYWHLNEIAVTSGQEIQPGDLIGYVGSTGLVTGPHLHWEMRLHGTAVNPLQWIQQTIP